MQTCLWIGVPRMTTNRCPVSTDLVIKRSGFQTFSTKPRTPQCSRRDMAEALRVNLPLGQKRIRASGPKVRSSCVTCKARRVKCDESKPDCLRCQKLGRKWDGYLASGVIDRRRPIAQLIARPLQPKTTHNFQSILQEPASALFDGERDYRYFRLFCDDLYSTRWYPSFESLEPVDAPSMSAFCFSAAWHFRDRRSGDDLRNNLEPNVQLSNRCPVTNQSPLLRTSTVQSCYSRNASRSLERRARSCYYFHRLSRHHSLRDLPWKFRECFHPDHGRVTCHRGSCTQEHWF
ncbi:hypothetical protein BDZ45DRAFT_291059 [Acephala macrosclerotiorum]|nr:hypothetical protein BDZ45DRAFT_291059 [Acephala macrosclerotiorum]